MKVEREFTTITYQRKLFRKEGIKKFSFFLKICYILIYVEKRWNEWYLFITQKTFLTMPNKLLYFSVYELICKLCGNNNLIWKLQFRYVGLLAEVSISLSIACYYCFYYFDSFYKHFSLGLDFLFFIFCKPRGVVVIDGNCFVWNGIRKYIQSSFV